MSTAAEKTSSLFSGFTTKLSQMKNSDSFKSFEGKVGGAYESVKVRLEFVHFDGAGTIGQRKTILNRVQKAEELNWSRV